MYSTSTAKRTIQKAFVKIPMDYEHTWLTTPATEINREDGKDLIVLFFPTLVSGITRKVFSDLLDTVYKDLSQWEPNDKQFLLVVGLQKHEELSATEIEAIEKLKGRYGKILKIFKMSTYGKLNSINVALQLGVQVEARGLGVFDNDLVLNSGSIISLCKCFCENDKAKCVIGIEIDNISGMINRGALLPWLKKHAKILVDYPMAAYMIKPSFFQKAVPLECKSDDGYFFFSSIVTDEIDPFKNIKLAKGAKGKHIELENNNRLYRTKRSMLSTHYLLAVFNEGISSMYREYIVFDGFWPLRRIDFSLGFKFAASRWISKLLLILLYNIVGLELLIRGIINRPIKEIAWKR